MPFSTTQASLLPGSSSSVQLVHTCKISLPAPHSGANSPTYSWAPQRSECQMPGLSSKLRDRGPTGQEEPPPQVSELQFHGALSPHVNILTTPTASCQGHLWNTWGQCCLTPYTLAAGGHRTHKMWLPPTEQGCQPKRYIGLLILTLKTRM